MNNPLTNASLRGTKLESSGNAPKNEEVHPTSTLQAIPKTEDEIKAAMRCMRDTITASLETLTGDEVSSLTVKLAALMANIGELLVRYEQEYYKRWQIERSKVDTDGRADKNAKASQEYYNRRIWELEFKATKELVNALKKRQKQLEIEEFIGGGQ